jgi:hypothetical protein
MGAMAVAGVVKGSRVKTLEDTHRTCVRMLARKDYLPLGLCRRGESAGLYVV